MKQPTELMLKILQREMAQRIIDFVSPIYGDSYVGLWIYEVIGAVIGEVAKNAEQLRYETNPITTELLMSYWEDQYGLYMDSSLTMDQRRDRLLEKIRFRAPANPEKLAGAMEKVLGVPVDITERVAKNTFQVNIQNAVADFRKLLHAFWILNKRKPAHLIYWVTIDSKVDDTTIKLANAITQEENYRIGVEAIKLSLQTTLEKAIKLGAAVTIDEQYHIYPDNVSIDTQQDIVSKVLTATPVSSGEEYSIETIKRIARIAVETAFRAVSPVFTEQEFNVEEVRDNE